LAPAAGLALAGLLLGYLISALFLFPTQNTAGELTRVPRVIGLPAEEARQAIEGAGLAYEEGPGLHGRHPAGTVVAQDPLPGQMAGPGSAVTVTLSLGPRLFPVPDVIGLSYAQAETALVRAGFESEVVWIDADAEVGQVIGTRPPAGTPIQLPGKVRVVASAGPRTVAVPDLVTRSLTEAEAMLKRLGLRLGSVGEDSVSQAAPGTVLTQRPAAGTVVARATRVNVTVAVAPEAGVPGDTASREPAGGGRRGNGTAAGDLTALEGRMGEAVNEGGEWATREIEG
jgi:serine/threonine-protein kinase